MSVRRTKKKKRHNNTVNNVPNRYIHYTLHIHTLYLESEEKKPIPGNCNIQEYNMFRSSQYKKTVRRKKKSFGINTCYIFAI